MDKYVYNLLNKKIAQADEALKVPFLTKRLRKQLHRRREGLVLERDSILAESHGVVI